MNEAFFVVRRHRNVHLELSRIPPSKLLEYFPGSRNWPTKRKILYGNADRIWTT